MGKRVDGGIWNVCKEVKVALLLGKGLEGVSDTMMWSLAQM